MSELSERLRHAHQHSTQRIVGSNIFEEAASRIEELEAQLVQANKCLDSYADENQRLHDRAEQAERALAEAVEVLRPFARFDHAMTSDRPDKCVIVRGRVSSVLTLSDFEAARQFVKAQEGK